MPQIQGIREQYREGSSVAELARIYGVDPKTVRKYLKHDDFSPKPGERRSDSSDYRTSLAVLMNNPGAWKNSGIRELIPDPLKSLMDRQERSQLHAMLKTMHTLSNEYGFEIAVQALEEGVQRSRTSFHDAAILAARIAGYGLNMAPERGQDLHVYDEFLEGVQV